MPPQLLLASVTLAALCAAAHTARARRRAPAVLLVLLVATVALNALRPHGVVLVDRLLWVALCASIPLAAEAMWQRCQLRVPLPAVLCCCAVLVWPDERWWLDWLPLPAVAYAATCWMLRRDGGWASAALAVVVASEAVGVVYRIVDPSPDGYMAQAVIWSLTMLAASALCVAGAVRREA